MMSRGFRNRYLFLLLIFLFSFDYGLAQAASFFEGKTITIIQGRRPGGLGDMRTRGILSGLSKFIPGNPTLATQYMPGAGGRRAANHISKAVRPDGLTIANIGAGFVSNAILGQPGVNYDIDKIIYLGSGNSKTSYVFGTREALGLDTLAKLRAASGVRIGGQSVGHDIYIIGRLFAWLLDLKNPRMVTGYSGPELDFALMRGEIDARANVADTVVKRSPDWINKKQVNFHAIVEIPKGFRLRHPAFADLPTMESFTRTDLERKVVQVERNFRLIGSPYLLPPGVPEDRAEILRAAFRNLYKDPEFFKAFRKLTGEDANPLTPEEQTQAIKEIPRDEEVLSLFKTIAGARPLPPR